MFIALLTSRTVRPYPVTTLTCTVMLFFHVRYKVSHGRPYLVRCSQLQHFVRPVYAGRQGDVKPIRREPTSVTHVDQSWSSRQRERLHLIYRWAQNCACLFAVSHSYYIERTVLSCSVGASLQNQPTDRLHPLMSALCSSVSD